MYVALFGFFCLVALCCAYASHIEVKELQQQAEADGIRMASKVDYVWWSNALLYRIDVRSFFDTNGDGVGDIKGE